MYGVITGYQLRFFKSDLSEGGQAAIIAKDRDELFHKVLAEDLPSGAGETFVEVACLADKC